MAPSFRKYESGCQKRKKQQRLQQLTQSQAGDILKFFKPTATTNHQATLGFLDQGLSNDSTEERRNENLGEKEQMNEIKKEKNLGLVEVESGNGNGTDKNKGLVTEEKHEPVDFYDPANWGSVISQHERDLLIKKGPIRVDIEEFPKDFSKRHFSKFHYIRKLVNGEKIDRRWLVYSSAVDKVFCFCCKLFKRPKIQSQLAIDGCNKWKNLGEKLKSHETSMEHIRCMSNWIELELRLQKNQTIDKNVQSAQI